MKKLSYTLSCIKQNVYTFLFYFLRLSCSYSSPSLYHLSGTQHQLTPPPVKSSTLPLKKMPVFQGVAPRHTILTSSCVIPLWDSATAHSPSGKELNPSSQEDAYFSVHCTSAYNFLFIQCHPSLGLSNSSLTLRYFYGERSLSVIFYSMCGLFL